MHNPGPLEGEVWFHQSDTKPQHEYSFEYINATIRELLYQWWPEEKMPVEFPAGEPLPWESLSQSEALAQFPQYSKEIKAFYKWIYHQEVRGEQIEEILKALYIANKKRESLD